MSGRRRIEISVRRRTAAAAWAVVAPVALALITLAFATPAARAALPRYGQKIVLLARGPVRTLDPAQASTPAERDIVAQLFEALTAPGLEGPRPAAAELWSSSDGGRTWTFHLRKGLSFSNGQPVEAADFVNSWERLRRLAPARVGWLEGAILRAPDALTFEIRLAKEALDLDSLAADPMLAAVRPVQSPQGESLVGSGPFRYGGMHTGAFILAPRIGHWAGRPTAGQLWVYPVEAETDLIKQISGADVIHGFAAPPDSDGLYAFRMPEEPRAGTESEPAAIRRTLTGFDLDRLRRSGGAIDLSGVWRRP